MAHRTFLACAGAAALATFADASKLHDMGLPAHFTSLHDSDAASRLASKLPAAAARPILRFDPSLFTSAEGPEEEAAWFDELNLHTEKIIDAAAKADADRLFPYVLCGPQTHAKRAREDLAVYASPSSASPPGSKIMAQMPAVVYASRRDNAACWLADLKPADARFVAMSPAFFHVSPKPAPAKFGPGLVEVEQDSGALKLNALAWAEDPSSGGLEVRFSGGVAASSVPDLAVTWAAADFGLRGDSAQDFLPFAEMGGSAKWKAARAASNTIAGGCAKIMDVSMDVDTNLREKTAPSRLTLSPRSGSSRTVGHEGCALQALAFLASQPEVQSIDMLLPTTTFSIKEAGQERAALELKRSMKAIFEAAEKGEPLPKTISTDRHMSMYLPLNYQVASLQSGSASDPTPFWDIGVDGSGMFVQVVDTGFDDASCFLRDTMTESAAASSLTGAFASGVQVARSTSDSPITDTTQRKVVQYVSRYSTNPFEKDYFAGHGTHVASTVAGNAQNTDAITFDYNPYCKNMSSSDLATVCATTFCPTCDSPHQCDSTCNFTAPDGFSGMAPGAKLMVYDFGDGNGTLFGGNLITEDAFQVAYDGGARIITNSWGTAPPINYYGGQSVDIDDFVYTHDDVLVLVAAGNQGQEPSYYDDDYFRSASGGDASIGSPAVSKNVLTVGAAETGKASPSTVAYFSSRGPTRDMRLKPEVCGPGMAVYAAEASGFAGKATCSVTPMAGTSMATPAVAGVAAMIRQYLVDGKHVTYSSAGYAASNYTKAAPSSALLKALLIGSTSPLPYGYPTTVSNIYSYSYGDLTRLDDMYDGTSGETYKLGTNGVDFTAGFGHVRMSNVFSIGGDFDTFLFEATLEEYSSWARTYVVTDVETEVDVTLVWNDPPGGSYCGFYFDNGMSDDPCLVHDLDLVVTHAGARLYPNFGAASVGDYSGEDDMYNNAEKVTIDASSLTVGDMIKVEVRTNGLSYASSQKFAVVATGAMSANESPTPSPVVAATTPAPIPAPTLVPTPLRSCEESCSERPEVLEAYNNQDLASFCALDYSCAANCNTTSYAMMDAMCVCGFDFIYSYSFVPEMCCGSGTCKAALFGVLTSMIDDDFHLDDAQDDDFNVKFVWDWESSGCTNYDCPSPTPEPTKSDTTSVAVSFEMTASTPATASDEAALQTTLASSLSVDESSIKDFTVVSTRSSRRARRNLLAASYTWTTSFTVAASLSSTSYSSAADFSSGVTAALSSSAFTSAVSSGVGASVDTSSIVTVLSTRNPTPMPVPGPTPSPIKSTDDVGKDGPGIAMIIAIAAAGVVVIIGSGAAAYIFMKTKKSAEPANKAGDELELSKLSKTQSAPIVIEKI